MDVSRRQANKPLCDSTDSNNISACIGSKKTTNRHDAKKHEVELAQCWKFHAEHNDKYSSTLRTGRVVVFLPARLYKLRY